MRIVRKFCTERKLKERFGLRRNYWCRNIMLYQPVNWLPICEGLHTKKTIYSEKTKNELYIIFINKKSEITQFKYLTPSRAI